MKFQIEILFDSETFHSKTQKTFIVPLLDHLLYFSDFKLTEKKNVISSSRCSRRFTQW